MMSSSVAVILLLLCRSNAFTATKTHQSSSLFPHSSQLYQSSEVADETQQPPENVFLLKSQLLSLASSTDRGFTATKAQRDAANGVIEKLAKINPTAEPAAPYYSDLTYIPGPNLSGKWTLVYTDAPDITGLASTPTAKLGRIGQECNPPYVKNVIEWKRPDWAANLPFSGSDESRILQKVCTKASASPSPDPLELNLELAGIELVVTDDDDEDEVTTTDSSFLDVIQSKGLPVGLLQQAPVQLEGPLTAPFGKARILYLDEELRILRTAQNFVAVNVRSNPEWF